jgi:hypothetical protein
MKSPPSLISCIIPAVDEVEGYDDETSESVIVIKMHEMPYQCCLCCPNIPHIVICTATRTNVNNINTHQNKGNNNGSIFGPESKEDPRMTMGMSNEATDTIETMPMLSSLSWMTYMREWGMIMGRKGLPSSLGCGQQ